MIHSVLVVQDSTVFFSKHYLLAEGRERGDYESLVLEIAEVERVFSVGKVRVVVSDSSDGTFVAVSGSGEMDEVLLSLVLEAVQSTLTSLLSAAGLSSKDLNTQPPKSLYAMLSLSLDELAPDGILDSLDVERNIAYAKLKV